MSCYWWNRWYHRRLRDLDRRVLWPAIVTRSEMAATALYERFTPDWSDQVDACAEALWALHRENPTEAHWHCDCVGDEA